ncbi:MAG: cytochrome c biogenesis protein CcsA [candidate division Zixibacteria bacterium]|nr:cytochrome c biogenesis protein CcsA [candidate division Zixibacteria bacterium]MDH3936918.1 cytochrome c biogenesis protein CcsA [candidate division Zixibacteria bacterium]MDH4033359.1 cytochrome c biogenesis protein CcsA [candidate division Zixibacteria bacterium]
MSWNSPGELLILCAFGMNLLIGFSFFRAARGHHSADGLARKSYHTFMICATAALVYLFYLFLSHNYAIGYVNEYSDSTLGFWLMLSAVWAGQEGSYLLWLFLSAAFGYVILRWGGLYRNWAMVVYSAINLFFLFILVKLSPFAMIDHVPPDGMGLNPLLQDFWMVIHPPVIFVGYASAGVPFALCLAALITNKYADWGRQIFPWVAVTALMIGMGNILGGYWAYKTLGWGGYWAWDPVENSSLIPWFSSLALLHGLLIMKRTDGGLRKTNILLGALTFILVIYGTFLTRSGVLADFSVHSFVDLGTNVYLIGFLIAFTVMTIALFAARARSVGHVRIDYNFWGREFTLVAATALLFIFSMIVLFWSSLPFLTSVFSNEPRAADIKTYNDFALPLAVIYSLMLAVSPFTKQDNFKLASWRTRLIASAGVPLAGAFGILWAVFGIGLVFTVTFSITIAAMAMYLAKPDWRKKMAPSLVGLVIGLGVSLLVGVREPMFLLLFAMTSMAIVTNLGAAAGCLPNRWKSMAGHLTHFGFGIMVIGVVVSSAFATNEQLILTTEEGGESYGVQLEYIGMANGIMHPRNELILTLDDGDGGHEIRPELYYSERMDGLMKRPHIERYLLNDLYFAPQQIQAAEGGGLQIAKGETHQLGEYQLTFLAFEMGSHSEGSGDLKVSVNLAVEHNGHVDTLTPGLVYSTDQYGEPTYISEPAFLDDLGTIPVNVEKVLADQGAVLLDIPGLMEGSSPEVLVLDITKKPLIVLVWIGTTLLLAGCVVSFLRRRSDVA